MLSRPYPRGGGRALSDIAGQQHGGLPASNVAESDRNIEEGRTPPPHRRRETRRDGLHRRRRKRHGRGTRGESRDTGAAGGSTQTGRRGGAWQDVHDRSTQRREAGTGVGESRRLIAPSHSPHRRQTYEDLDMRGLGKRGRSQSIHGALGKHLQRTRRRPLAGPPRTGQCVVKNNTCPAGRKGRGSHPEEGRPRGGPLI